jgi:hypothetical protein
VIAYLRFDDPAEWPGARALLPPSAQIDKIGTVYHQTGTTVVDGLSVPVMTARPGWHVNVIAEDIPAALHPFLVNPAQPKRVYFGTEVLSMPEPLPEAGGTAMVERGVGGTAADDVIARIERTVLLGRLLTEQAADRIALLTANLALVDARALRGQRLAERGAAIAAVLAADNARDALVVQRDAQTAIRTQAIAQLVGLTGAARLPVVAVRDAATAEVARLAPLLTEANAVVVTAMTARDAATDALTAVNAQVVTLRAARDALLV